LVQLVLYRPFIEQFSAAWRGQLFGGTNRLQVRRATPKLTAIAVGTLNDQDFYNRLERAIERSERVLNAKLIEGHAIRDEYGIVDKLCVQRYFKTITSPRLIL
jgi:hypothetical protein